MPSQTGEASSAYRCMRLIRRFEQRVAELVNQNEIAGVTHEYVGQEAVAVGACFALNQDDVITSTHRGHGHVIAKGGDVGRMIAELMGRESGMNRGRGGSMHIADVGLGVYGANGIVAAGAPIAAGAAWAASYRRTSRVALTYFGDGGANQGVLFETLNLATLWRLPLIFVCENNGYAATVPVACATGVRDIAERASAFGMPAESVDGMDVRAVRRAAETAVDRARSGEGPTFLECITYRFVGHHTAEVIQNLGYRTEDEVSRWKLRDPLEREAAELLKAHEADQAGIEAIDADVERELASAIEAARGAPRPKPETACDYMYQARSPVAQGWSI
jgi:TPP-dependent pyruvate/acetoin dehydrogenase alpha subunit